MTREDVETLKVGDLVKELVGPTRNGEALEERLYAPARKVTEIFGRGICVQDGRPYVCFYREFGENGASISGSCYGGEDTYEVVR